MWRLWHVFSPYVLTSTFTCMRNFYRFLVEACPAFLAITRLPHRNICTIDLWRKLVCNSIGGTVLPALQKVCLWCSTSFCSVLISWIKILILIFDKLYSKLQHGDFWIFSSETHSPYSIPPHKKKRTVTKLDSFRLRLLASMINLLLELPEIGEMTQATFKLTILINEMPHSKYQ